MDRDVSQTRLRPADALAGPDGASPDESPKGTGRRLAGSAPGWLPEVLLIVAMVAFALDLRAVAFLR